MSAALLRAELLPHGGLRALRLGELLLNAYPANAMEAGPANLWLRRLDEQGEVVDAVALLGPASPLQPLAAAGDIAWAAAGRWQGLRVALQLRLAQRPAAWFWHVELAHDAQGGGAAALRADLVSVQDLGLAPAAALRSNEFYASHYIDLQPLMHPELGPLLAARQNQPVAGQHPWLITGALTRCLAWASDGLQWFGAGARGSGEPDGLRQRALPSTRLQHEHAMAVLQLQPVALAPGEMASVGVWGLALPDHAGASGDADAAWAAQALALPQARPAPMPLPMPAAATLPAPPAATPPAPFAASLFGTAPLLAARSLRSDELDALFAGERLHAEHDADGTLLGFWRDGDAHVVLQAKELRVQRPHGLLLRGGRQRVPDERTLASTCWMAGIFHSLLTQGHVGINRCLGTQRGWLGQYRSLGQRVFVDAGAGWRLLGLPSAFEMRPDGARWLYAHGDGLFELEAAIPCDAQDAVGHAATLQLRVLQGPPLRLLVSHQVALGGDEGFAPVPAPPLALQPDGALWVGVAPGGELATRFPRGGLRIEPLPGTRFAAAGGDGLLHADGRDRGGAWACVRIEACIEAGLALRPQLVDDAQPQAAPPQPALQGDWPVPRWQLPDGPLAQPARELAQIQPWLLHDALVHYLAPRGLEQFSGGGWGTRDVAQGPLEMLLALQQPAAARELLCRLFAAQDAGGDWPQWFMFFARERAIRAGDSHGDIVFWPLLALARYLRASGDAALLAQPLPYHDGPPEPLWSHVQRALAVIAARLVPGTALAAYGHGDWNDSLQPADPALRERLCSAWTVTLHHQMLAALAEALDSLGQHQRAAPLRAQAATVRAEFRARLLPGGQVPGYLLFGAAGAAPEPLLHPADTRTGLRASLLPMMHAVLENLLDPAEAEHHAGLIDALLLGPDGARLFDRPLPYRGGPMQLFQRGESSAFFGREIGLMYTHAHLRWAQMLAHLGRAEALFRALRLAHPLGLQALLPQASRRQANCYYSSSDAAFPDRAAAQRDYAALAHGQVALDGGWRVYSSGPGLMLAIVVERLLGLRVAHDQVVLDPVLPPALAGLVATLPLWDHLIELELQPGPLGHGPTAVTLDGKALPFRREPNPYRVGGASVDAALLRDALAAGARRLSVRCG